MMRDVVAERALIERFQAGEAAAVADLESAYGAKIYQLAFRYMKNSEDAEEVTQDVLMKVFKKVSAFRGDAALTSWIYRITFNTAMSRLRNAKFSRSLEVLEDGRSFFSESGERESYKREPADW
ncbi:MAG: sigma-70 family RNA polymerase sigma factor [Vicinamibacterales bacterium]|nr:sigma-70 family RNA polymerase sigma factor [Vicinamibacterales bacterium]MDP7471237.1 sigma-70 family RNA polymerase sigma factor [Vicinamibacterales bacterium]MDP7672625.1 sigma-70 family RNA polymerase sigma factor [Vicinamibacterales bacterium]HJO36991.1 sigma-70 family RNA polymerase sigma factor [Vicinamibacterales bacterium]